MTDVTMADTSIEPERRATPWAVTWLTWPLLFATTIGVIFHALRDQLDGILRARIQLVFGVDDVR